MFFFCFVFVGLDPFILPHQQVDKGAIKFVLSGANIMCPGLTSPGAKLYPAGPDTVVVSFIVTNSDDSHYKCRQFPPALSINMNIVGLGKI